MLFTPNTIDPSHVPKIAKHKSKTVPIILVASFARKNCPLETGLDRSRNIVPLSISFAIALEEEAITKLRIIIK